MTMTEYQIQEFEALAQPIIKWLNDNLHPHVSVIITPIHAEVVEGLAAFTTKDYLND